MNATEARKRGREDGAHDVREVVNEERTHAKKVELLRRSLRPGALGWDEAAINAGVARIVGIPARLERAYYEAYANGANKEARALLAEYEND